MIMYIQGCLLINTKQICWFRTSVNQIKNNSVTVFYVFYATRAFIGSEHLPFYINAIIIMDGQKHSCTNADLRYFFRIGLLT